MAYTFSSDIPCPRSFTCRLCGELVSVYDPDDRRTVFCCEDHEIEYWKHRERYCEKPVNTYGNYETNLIPW